MNKLNINSREELIKYFKPSGIGIEIGVYQGEFSKYILDNCPDLNLILLDCWQKQTKDEYNDDLNSENDIQIERINKTIKNIINHYHRVKIIKGFSDEFSKLFSDNIFDFVFIDANHSYESIKKDLNNFYPKVKKGGLFAGHDYVNTSDKKIEVEIAVNEFARENNINIYITNEHWPTWFFIK